MFLCFLCFFEGCVHSIVTEYPNLSNIDQELYASEEMDDILRKLSESEFQNYVEEIKELIQTKTGKKN